MAKRKFTIEEVEFMNPGDYPIGVIKDTYLDQGAYGPGFPPVWNDHNTWNFGVNAVVRVGDESDGYNLSGGRHLYTTVLEIQMPNISDVIGMDEIIKVELILTTSGSAWTDVSFIVIGIVEISDNFDEGGLVSSFGFCSWDKFIDSVEWQRGKGACASQRSIAEIDGTVIDTVRLNPPIPPNIPITFDLTEVLSPGDKKRFAIFVIDDNVSDSPGQNDVVIIEFCTKEHTTTAAHPKLKLTYQDFAPEGFDTQDNRLEVIPNPDDRRLPIFLWGGVSADDLVDYKLYWSTASFSLPSLATLMATITDTSAEEYLGLIANISTVNQARYFRLIAEDSNNLIDDALISNIVSYIRPQLIEAEADRTVLVGDTVTITLSTNAGTPCKKVYVEWGDTPGYWIEKETEFTSVTLTHTYSAKGSYVVKSILESSPPDGNAETGGYWSGTASDGGKTTICTVTVNDTNPRAILTARPVEAVVGEIIRLNAALSHPIASNETLQYQFYKNGVSLGGWNPNPIKTYTALVGDVSTTPIEFTCKVRNSLLLESALSTIEYVSVISNKPTTLAFSRDTVITSRGEGRQTGVDSAMVQGGSQEEDVRYGLGNVVISIEGISSRYNMPTDLELIKDAVEDYDYVQLKVKDELCGAYVYYAGRMISYRINKTTARSVSWSVEFRVNIRSLVDLSL